MRKNMNSHSIRTLFIIIIDLSILILDPLYPDRSLAYFRI